MAIPNNLSGDSGLFSNGKTPIHFAVERGNSELCKILLESQVSKNFVDNQGSTPLHESVKMGYLEVSKILLAKQVEKILLRIVDFHHFIGLLEMVIPKYVRF